MNESDRPMERYMTAGELAERMGIPTEAILRFHAEGRLHGRRMPGTVDAVQFRMSEVEAAWDCVNQLALAEERRGMTVRAGVGTRGRGGVDPGAGDGDARRARPRRARAGDDRPARRSRRGSTG